MSLTIIIARLLIPPPPTPASARNPYNISLLWAHPQPTSPIASSAKQSSKQFFLPKISLSLPLISWKAVLATRKDDPIQAVEVPVFRSEDMLGMEVETEVVSMKETNKATERAGMAIRRCFGESSLVWLPMLWMLALSERVESEVSAASGAAETVSFSFVSGTPFSSSDGETRGSGIGLLGCMVVVKVVKRCGQRIR
jgi:hypothetical protein